MGQSVIVIGGGYGGSLVARALDAEAEVTLIDPREAFVNAAASLRALTQPGWAPNAFFPFDSLLERGRVIRDEAVSVDPRGVTLASGAQVEGDYLVLATGSDYIYPAKPHTFSTTIAQQLADLRETHRELAGAGRVLILGAGPVGLELAGEIKEIWPAKHVVIVDRHPELLPGFLPAVRGELQRRLDEIGIEVRLGTGLTALPEVPAGRTGRFTVTTGVGEEITADIWFQAFGVRLNTGYLTDSRLVELTDRGTVPVTERMNVVDHDHVFAIGDVVEHPDPKMASYAMTQAEVVVTNLRALLAGREAGTAHGLSERRILLPLGTRTGVGQLPAPGGVVAASPETVQQRKGADLFTARFAERFSSAR